MHWVPIKDVGVNNESIARVEDRRCVDCAILFNRRVLRGLVK